MPKKKTFEQAKKEISEKYSYLKLLEFNGNDKKALFLDKEYGEFKGNYRSILRNRKTHPIRMRKNKKERARKTNLKKYGCIAPAQNKTIQNKIKETNLKKYGVEHPQQNKNIREKTKITNLQKYNSEWVVSSKLFHKKRNNSMINKYNTIHPQQNKEIREKTKITVCQKYNVENISQSEKIKNKKIETSRKNFNCDYPFQSKKIKEKIKNTCIQKYGSDNPAKNNLIKKKIIQSNIKNGNYYNINGVSLMEYYNNSELNKFGYSTIQRNYKKYGNKALQITHYNKLHRKSKIANLWLNSIEKELGYTLIREFHIKSTRYHADGYDPKTNTVYEFYGDYWHGNLNKFSAIDIHPVKGITFKELYKDTKNRQKIINSLGYNIIYIWEDNFNALNKMP